MDLAGLIIKLKLELCQIAASTHFRGRALLRAVEGYQGLFVQFVRTDKGSRGPRRREPAGENEALERVKSDCAEEHR